MARPKKKRHCSCAIRGRVFKPTGIPLRDIERIQLGQDELETLKLCDLEGLSQEEAGRRMNVSRGTVQRLVASGRKKVIESLLNGSALELEEDEDSA